MKGEATKFFHDVLNNVKPRVEVRSRRVGGATYQVPMEVKVDRSQALAIRWIIDAARKRGGKNMKMKLYQEFYYVVRFYYRLHAVQLDFSAV